MSLLARAGPWDIRQPHHSGEHATCTHCQAEMRGRVGAIKIPHWAHLAQASCDPWSAAESQWHLGWKRDLAACGCAVEVTMRKHGERHRADAVTPAGLVVELQHGYLPQATITARERFYGRMVWIYDARAWHNSGRLHIGRQLADRHYGLWFKGGGRSLAEHHRQIIFDVGHGQAWLVTLDDVTRTDEFGGTSHRILGKVATHTRDDVISWILGIGAPS